VCAAAFLCISGPAKWSTSDSLEAFAGFTWHYPVVPTYQPTRLRRHASEEAHEANTSQEPDASEEPGVSEEAGASKDADGVDEAALRAIFTKMDTDADGLIEEASFIKAMQSLGKVYDNLSEKELDELFLIADADKDSLISFADFSKWVSAAREALACFYLVDSDSDGCITREEWRTVFEKMALDLKEQNSDKIFDRLDVDSSGTMSFIEFFKYVNDIGKKEGPLKRARKWFAEKLTR